MRFDGRATAPLHNTALRAPSLLWIARKCQDFSLFFEESRMTLIARMASPLFEIAFVLLRFDHVASVMVNANHGMMGTAEKLGVAT
jgi:hypothetical protein